ncbi:MAG: hypothetical protein LBC53_07755 [Spirochaetaceae bacterium]|jgi:hypothetical protein|nr:hypothetical protein [Spirochaetaceae bacterium]
MNEFKITPEKKKELAKVFNTNIETVNLLEKVYSELDITSQYLAHVIRSMESSMRKITGNQLFSIVCEPSLSGANIGSAQYFYKRFFVVHFNPAMPEKELRIYLAHELGHLFITAIVNYTNDPSKRRVSDKDMEPLSSIFGVFTMADKNDFYRNVKEAPINHSSWNEMIESFLSLKAIESFPSKNI